MFKSQELQKIDSEVAEIIKKRIEEVGEISVEIKILEERLKTISLPYVFCHNFQEDIERESQVPPFLKITKQHCLVWGKDEYNKMRFMYSIKSCVYEDIELKTTRIIFSKPLIECNLNIRIMVKNHIAPFYEKIIEEYKKLII